MENNKTQLTLSIAGMDERSKNTLGFFFEKFCNNRCQITNEQNAMATIVNMDSVDAKAELERLKASYPKRTMILTSVRQLEIDTNDYFLRKPMIAEQLLEIVDQIMGVRPKNVVAVKHEQIVKKKASKTHSSKKEQSNRELVAFSGNAEDINLRNVNYTESCFFELADYFAGYLRQAILKSREEKAAIRITGLWQPVFVFADSNQIYMELSERQVKPLCVVTLESSGIDKKVIQMDVLKKEQALVLCKQHKYYQVLDRFTWRVALWTSHGRIPNTLPCDSPLYLSGWPNLTRLDPIPHALKLCACWIQHPRTIINLSEVLTIPQKYLFPIITACYVLGIADLAKRQADTLIAPAEIKPTEKLNFFMRIMTKLRNNS